MQSVSRIFIAAGILILSAQSRANCSDAYSSALRGYSAERATQNKWTSGITVGGGAVAGAAIGTATGSAVSSVPGATVGAGVGAFGGGVFWMMVGTDIGNNQEMASSVYRASQIITDAYVGDSLALRRVWRDQQKAQIAEFDYSDMIKTIKDLNEADQFCLSANVVNDNGVVSLTMKEMSARRLFRLPK